MNYKERVKEVARLLSDKRATHANFMIDVVNMMEKEHSFTIECHQQGIRGTYVRIAQVREQHETH